MSRDQRPGRANLIDGATLRTAGTPAAPTDTGLPAIDPRAPAIASSADGRRTGLLAIVFVVASAVGGIGVSVLRGLQP